VLESGRLVLARCVEAKQKREIWQLLRVSKAFRKREEDDQATKTRLSDLDLSQFDLQSTNSDG